MFFTVIILVDLHKCWPESWWEIEWTKKPNQMIRQINQPWPFCVTGTNSCSSWHHQLTLQILLCYESCLVSVIKSVNQTCRLSKFEHEIIWGMNSWPQNLASKSLGESKWQICQPIQVESSSIICSIGNNFDLGLFQLSQDVFNILSSFVHVSLKEYNATLLGQMHTVKLENTLFWLAEIPVLILIVTFHLDSGCKIVVMRLIPHSCKQLLISPTLWNSNPKNGFVVS